jgi:hypothetical protein
VQRREDGQSDTFHRPLPYLAPALPIADQLKELLGPPVGRRGQRLRCLRAVPT